VFLGEFVAFLPDALSSSRTSIQRTGIYRKEIF